MPAPCPFCTLPDERMVDHNGLAVTIRDGFPVSTGHAPIIPRRHVGCWFELTADAQQDMLKLRAAAKS